ncbi:hypothetical protein [Fibrobacter sp.]|uniref:hypothetical protein n=1 Tax=Fibrobacter sp. TaxID=35828 RepID=UPI00388EE968
MTIAEVLWVFGVAIFLLLALLIVVLMKMWETINGIRTRMNGIYDYLADIDGKLDYFDGDLEELRSVTEANNKMFQDIMDACDEDEEEEEEEELPIHLITKEQYESEEHEECEYRWKGELEYNSKTNELFLITKCFGRTPITGDWKLLIGDALMYFGVCSKCDKTVYVRNHNTNADYRITKV